MRPAAKHAGPRTFLLLLLLAVASFVGAQSGWERKPYTEWTEAQVIKLLQDSPWAREYSFSQTYIEPLGTDSSERGREANPRFVYHAQLRSALPIRQALVRQSMIAQKYAHLPPDKRKEFDDYAQRFLAQTFPDRIVVYVVYGSNVDVADREAARFWQVQPLDKVRNFMFLSGRGKVKAPPDAYAPGSGNSRAFRLEFPRVVNGQPIVTEKDKSLTLEFNHPSVPEFPAARVFLEFKISKMKWGQNLAY